MPKRIFITVAEVSADQHAAHLVRSLRELDPQVIVEGHGGPAMRQAGAIVHCETTVRAAMGLAGVGRLVEMLRLLRWTRSYFNRQRPDLLICIDSPAMNFPFAKLAHGRGVPVLYYIAPQLWAWREGRIRKLRRWVSHVACILPFEQEYFQERGVPATFVGHPLFDELQLRRGAAGVLTGEIAATGRTSASEGTGGRVVGILPGSRKSEATANLPPLLEVAQRLRGEFPGVRFLIPTTPGTHVAVRKMVGTAPDIKCAQDSFDRLVLQCDLCLTASGTATLHVAGHGVPMVVVYRMNKLVVRALGWLMKTDTFALVNLLAPARRHIVPEFVPWLGDPAPVADCAIDLLRHPEKLAAQRSALAELVSGLDKPGASMSVARLAMGMIGADQ